MPVRSDRLFGPLELPAGGTTDAFTVPVGETWLVKTVMGRTGASGLAGVELRIRVGAGTNFGVAQLRADGEGDFLSEAWMALDAGVTLQLVNLSAITAANVIGFGAKLLGVAP